ncbi:MAG: hypothetical protein R3F11_31500 [Verrucomicrobiales bacterium]
MKYFGCRSSFAIEVGDTSDRSKHTRLDFYTHDIHLNRLDNAGHVGTCLSAWPCWDTKDDWPCTAIYWEVPFSTAPEALLARLLADGDLWAKHATFRLGPVTDSFSMFAFSRPDDFILIFLRTDGWGGDDLSDLAVWNVTTQAGWRHTDPTSAAPVCRWLSTTIPKQEFIQICSSAHDALAASQVSRSR